MELGEVKVFTKIFCFGCQGLFKTTNLKCTKYNAELYFRIREKKKNFKPNRVLEFVLVLGS